MPSQNADPTGGLDPTELTFAWPKAERWYQSRLWRFLATAVFGHILAFQLFQVVTREQVTAPGRERELQLLSHDLPQHQAFLDAVEAEVPLAALSHQLLSINEELTLRPYRSAFADSPPSPKAPAFWTPKAKTLVPKFSDPHTQSEPPLTMARFVGRLQLSAPLTERLESSPELPTAPAGKLLESPSFLIGVSASGEVHFVFLDRTSGDSEADFAAEQALRKTVFTKTASETQWGEALLVWRSAP